MATVAHLSFDDDDPDLHVHFTAYARALDTDDPVEFARVLRTLEDALTAYAARVRTSRERLETAVARVGRAEP